MMVAAVGCTPDSGETSTATETTTTSATTEDATTTTAATTGATSTGTTTEPTSGSTSAGTSTGTTDGQTTGGACALPPLTDEVVESLGFDVFGATFEMQPGDTRSLAVGAIECCYVKNPVEACVEYSVSPGEGASIDPVTGEFKVLPDAVPGTVYTVTADVEAGRAVLMAEVYVYTPESNPFVGIWHEVAQLPCGGGPEVAPEMPIGELWFRASGDVNVTWTPFEIYVDYWGDYTYDLMTGDLSITPTGGNYVPADVEGAGKFTLQGTDLVLEDMWLGSPQGAVAPANCGHRFQR